MIPICEPRNGDIIAFSGRDILDREKVGKYVNSPENPVYHKSSTLFGLDRARAAIKEQDAVILVEGNLDVIFAHERGFTNTVATCGTALTDDHLRALRRLTNNFYLAFDNDLAGKKATLKGVEMCLQMELNPFVLALDNVKDFGDFLADDSNTSTLQEMIENAPGALSFFLERFAIKNLSRGIEGEKKFLDSFFFFLKLVNRPIEVDEYLGQVAAKLGRGKTVIEDEFKKFTANQSNYTKAKFVPETVTRFSREQSFVGFVYAFWPMIGPSLTAKKEEILALVSESGAKTLLIKKFDDTPLDTEESTQATAWELWEQNKFESEDIDPAVLKITLQQYVVNLRKEVQKRERLAAAKAMTK